MSEALVETRIYPGQPGLTQPGLTQPGLTEDGLTQDFSNGDEGVDYLRRLKGAPADADARGGGEDPAAANSVANSVAWKERRQSPRLRCSGSAEFRTAASDVRIWGTVTDISLHGCYVQMNTTFPVGTKVDLVLKSFGVRIEAPGTVRASYPFLGMGICFAEIQLVQRLHLKDLLTKLAGRSAVSSGISAQEDSMKVTLRSADPRAFLDEVTEFFQKNQLLSRNEFHQIAKRARRS
jgi:hypothetical protein